ncbi:hypothetical protein [Microbacterium trichothecenolyticum]|uniref:Uncharacterized protein n=1 Tax=Microbacterium trichothecenolyticum TaxID=69370 RepID=A0A0M2H126_MICTR|nr:hypothetical protein [Microbacterium trichothecenolyticum]KJL39902.1 hypothetical protein RS82_04115 [Microbacterium trichothecenolyticum]
MVYSDRATGAAGQMRIDFDGTTVRFYVYGGYSTTNSGGLGWSGVVNGVGVGGSTAWPTGSKGAPGILFGAWTANYGTQTVSFTLNYTGTSGLGGPTTHTMTFTRENPTPPASPPDAPNNLRLRAGTLTHQSFGVDYNRGATHGAAITADIAEWWLGVPGAAGSALVWQDGTGAPGNGPNSYTNPQGNGLGAGPGPLLLPGLDYYVRIKSDAYGVGWSGWSATFSLRTLPNGRIKTGGSYRDLIRWRKISGVWRRSIRWRKVDGTWRRVR